MKIVKCPNCKKEVEWKNNKFKPFCSKRCKLIDLGEWASGSYAIPSQDNSTGDIISNQSEEE